MDQLQRLAPGLRPPLFHSPYEAAAWSIISARRNATQMTKVRASLCAEHGVAFDISGERVAAFPPPDVLRRITQFPGLDATKISRLHAVAVAASAGALDASHLSLIGADTAMTELQQIPGIGPFYATLITVRAVGFADLAPAEEPRLLAIAGRLYGTGAPMSITEFTKLSEAWAPYRTWASVLLRSTGPLLNN